MGGGGVSKSQSPARPRARSGPSRLCAEIDERVGAFPTRPIEGRWPYLWLDATDLKVREDGRIVSRAATVAVAVNDDGRREVPGVATGPSEAEVRLGPASFRGYCNLMSGNSACGCAACPCLCETIRNLVPWRLSLRHGGSGLRA